MLQSLVAYTLPQSAVVEDENSFAEPVPVAAITIRTGSLDERRGRRVDVRYDLCFTTKKV